MTKWLGNMTLDELQSGYEKGKVTDEEIEQHFLERLHQSVKNVVKIRIRAYLSTDEFVYNEDVVASISTVYSSPLVVQSVQQLAEHEYQKLKDNE